MFQILCTSTYNDWFEKQTLKTQGQIQSRLERITEYGHFGDAKHLSSRLSELKWKNGLRVYFAITVDNEEKTLILLLGGTKNSQGKDIAKAKKIISEIIEDEK